MPAATEPIRSEPERARRQIAAGILVFRWAALVWMAALAATGDPLAEPGLAWALIGAAGAWTAWLTAPGRHDGSIALGIDLALAMALMTLSGVVMPEGSVLGGRPFFATAYPAAAVVSWGARRGVAGGLFAGFSLGLAMAGSRPANGVALAALDRAEAQSLANGAMMLLLAGLGVGVVARSFDRSAAQLQEAIGTAMRERERAGRLAERESLARRIHDSVLQSLALVHKRGRELGAREQVPGSEVAALAELAGRQEAELRALVMREPDDAPAGRSSLRAVLEAAAREVAGVPVTVSAVGPLWMPAAAAGEVAGAVRQALANVAEHAAASRASVFAEREDDTVVVTVRDDGRGFVYDEEALRRDQKAGLLKSIKGRVEDLGGTMSVDSAPGRGTEIELRVPVEGDE